MNTITTTITEMKRSMPRHVLWLVMFAAFLVVVILFVLLITKKSPEAPPKSTIELVLTADPAETEWLDVPVGEKETRQIKITVNDFAMIPSVELSEKVEGLTIKDTCVHMGEIAPEIPCSIDLTWKPESPLKQTGINILVKYHSANADEKMAQTAEIPVVLSAKKEEAKPASKPEPPFAEAQTDKTAGKPESYFEEEPYFEPDPYFESEEYEEEPYFGFWFR